MGGALWGQGTLAWMLGDRGSIERAVGLFEEASLVYREIDDVFQFGWTDRMLGRALLVLGRVDEARVRIRAAIDVFVVARCSAVTLLLLDCAIIALRRGDRERALRLAGAMRALRDTTGTVLADYRVNLVEEIDQMILDAGEQGQRLLDEGAALPYDEVVAYALESV